MEIKFEIEKWNEVKSFGFTITYIPGNIEIFIDFWKWTININIFW